MINSIIILDHRGRMDKGSRMTLEIRLTINRASYYISTGVRVRRSEFVGGAVVNRADAME